MQNLKNPFIRIPRKKLKNNYLLSGLSPLESRMIAKTFAYETKSTFFNVTTSEFFSDEKIISLNKVKGCISFPNFAC
jgi:hypothetical protein